MAKLSRSEQARRNGAKSKGPVTPEGKQRSSRNSLKHGLTSRSLVLINEEKAEFEALLASWTEKFRPADDVEFSLVVRMAAARWRVQRCWAMETAMLDRDMSATAREFEAAWTGHDEELRKANSFRNLTVDGNSFHNLQRYEAMLERSFDRAMRRLHELQDRRRNSPGPQDDPLPIESLDREPKVCVTPDQTNPSESFYAGPLQTPRNFESLIPPYPLAPNPPRSYEDRPGPQNPNGNG